MHHLCINSNSNLILVNKCKLQFTACNSHQYPKHKAINNTHLLKVTLLNSTVATLNNNLKYILVLLKVDIHNNPKCKEVIPNNLCKVKPDTHKCRAIPNNNKWVINNNNNMDNHKWDIPKDNLQAMLQLKWVIHNSNKWVMFSQLDFKFNNQFL